MIQTEKTCLSLCMQMSSRRVRVARALTRLLFVVSTASFCLLASNPGSGQSHGKKFLTRIPRTWNERALQSQQIPLANRAMSPKQISADYYYRMPVRPIYKSYPVYYPDREPRGYWESLKLKEPEIVFDESRLRTAADWIKAGELVFDAPIEFVSDGTLYSETRGRAWYDINHVPLTKEGVMPFMRYVVRQKGKVELGILSCAACHTRVMPDGSTIKGAQGNFPDDRAFGYETRIEAGQTKDVDKLLAELRKDMRREYAAPWVSDDPKVQFDRLSLDEIVSALAAITPGSCARQGASIFYPAAIPDLIGVKERRFLDSTGVLQQRNIGDLMRYAAINQGADLLSLYGTFRPRDPLPEPSTQSRYSDAQLYALALYIYSLKPPPNPNKFDALAASGRKVFFKEGCEACHTPPLYTNNTLEPVDGFDFPKEYFRKYAVMDNLFDTDPNLTLKTRRGTGFYKVPSLKGVWYRGPFEHNGSVTTLEDWFDPRRIKDDYVPTGFRGPGVKARAVPGHEYGLQLKDEERKALIAFLKTL
jgi:hypothetical protein